MHYKFVVNSVVSCRACNFIKKDILAQLFSWEFYEIFKDTFFIEHPLPDDCKEF